MYICIYKCSTYALWQGWHWYLVSQWPPWSWSCLNGLLLDEANLPSVTYSTPATWVTGLLDCWIAGCPAVSHFKLRHKPTICHILLLSVKTTYFPALLSFSVGMLRVCMCVWVLCVCYRNYSLPVNLISDRLAALVSRFDKYAIRMRNWSRNLVACSKLATESGVCSGRLWKSGLSSWGHWREI